MGTLEIIIITLLSIFQSIFGVGLLVIGTPIFLQLGYDFLTVLNILLPFSVMISILQRMTSGSINHLFKTNFIIIAIPFVFISLFIVHRYLDNLDILLLVALVMILFSIINIIFIKNDIKIPIKKMYLNTSLIFLGILHGFTNLGGSLLTLISSNISNNKLEVRGNIAYGYLVFGIIQMFYLLLFFEGISFSYLIYIFIPILAFYLSQSFYNKINSSNFSLALNFFVLVYGIYLIVIN